MTTTHYRKRPVEVDAAQWHQNGDHPNDGPAHSEGAVVRYFRRPEPEYAGTRTHDLCGYTWHRHGWIDTLEGGHTVCPGDWIITGVQGEHYPCKPGIFAATYERVDGPTSTAVAALAEAYGPMADLDDPRHPVNDEKPDRVLSALYRSAEDAVTRVIDLHEQWVAAGPPPLGVSLARWWDTRLAELHNAIQPADQTTEK